MIDVLIVESDASERNSPSLVWVVLRREFLNHGPILTSALFPPTTSTRKCVDTTPTWTTVDRTMNP
jgi:hypothetical protein